MAITDLAKIAFGDTDYPESLRRYLKSSAPQELYAIGKVQFMHQKKLALVSSIKCPGSIIIKTYDMARALRQARTVSIGGFHSPMEREALDILLRGEQPIIVCPPKCITHGRLSKLIRQHAALGKILILSFFGDADRRTTRDRADYRNECLSAMADAVLIAHASPGGHAEQLAQKVLDWRKPLYCLEDDANEALRRLGAMAISPSEAGFLFG